MSEENNEAWETALEKFAGYMLTTPEKMQLAEEAFITLNEKQDAGAAVQKFMDRSKNNRWFIANLACLAYATLLEKHTQITENN